MPESLARMQAARKHYCVHKSVIKTGNIDEECNDLLKSKQFGCLFAQNIKRQGVSHSRVQTKPVCPKRQAPRRIAPTGAACWGGMNRGEYQDVRMRAANCLGVGHPMTCPGADEARAWRGGSIGGWEDMPMRALTRPGAPYHGIRGGGRVSWHACEGSYPPGAPYHGMRMRMLPRCSDC
eukprot:1158242-Pelagomonas_calceolata.AAC.2